MKFAPAHSIRIVAFLALVMAGVSAHAGVVFGNLGASGTGALGGTNTDFGPSDTDELAIAQGFNTGTSSLLDIQSVTLGLFVTNSGTNENRTVSIYSDSSGAPGSILFTSQPVGIGNTGAYTFPFSGATLSASTPYWIVAEGPSSWYTAPGSLFTLPTSQNGSSYSATTTLVNSATSSTWGPSQINSYSVSVVAVPEPPAIVMAGIGIASAIWSLQRRRKSA